MSNDFHVRSDIHWERKIWHCATVLIMAAVYAFAPTAISLSILWFAIALFVPLDFLRLRNPRLNHFLQKGFRPIMRDSETTGVAGTTYLLTGVAIVTLFFDSTIVLLTLLFLAIADPVASYFGIKFGKRKVFGHKSWEGFLAAFLVCTFISLVFFSQVGDLPLTKLLIASFFAGLIGAAAELIPVAGLDDNFTLPVLAAIGLSPLFVLIGVV